MSEQPSSNEHDDSPAVIGPTSPMPFAFEYVLAAARELLLRVDENHGSKEPPLKYVAPWAQITALRDAVLKFDMKQHSADETIDARTVWEKARDAIGEAIKQAPDTNRRILATNAYHEIAEAMRGTPCTDGASEKATTPLCAICDHNEAFHQVGNFTHAFTAKARVVPSVCGKPMPDGKGAGQCINPPGHEGDCDDMPF